MSTQREVQLLERAIEASGLSTARFAREIVLREPSTVGRWIDRSSPIPSVVVEWLEKNAGVAAAK